MSRSRKLLRPLRPLFVVLALLAGTLSVVAVPAAVTPPAQAATRLDKADCRAIDPNLVNGVCLRYRTGDRTALTWIGSYRAPDGRVFFCIDFLYDSRMPARAETRLDAPPGQPARRPHRRPGGGGAQLRRVDVGRRRLHRQRCPRRRDRADRARGDGRRRPPRWRGRLPARARGRRAGAAPARRAAWPGAARWRARCGSARAPSPVPTGCASPARSADRSGSDARAPSGSACSRQADGGCRGCGCG